MHITLQCFARSDDSFAGSLAQSILKLGGYDVFGKKVAGMRLKWLATTFTSEYLMT